MSLEKFRDAVIVALILVLMEFIAITVVFQRPAFAEVTPAVPTYATLVGAGRHSEALTLDRSTRLSRLQGIGLDALAVH